MLEIYYAGGAGGHFLLHLILLSNKHICSFVDYPVLNDSQFPHIFNTVFNKQWNIQDRWKDTECDVDNNETLKLPTLRHKLVQLNCFFNDPVMFLNSQEHIETTANTTISITPSSSLHRELIKFKIRKNIPNDIRTVTINAWNKFYADIRDSKWPDIEFDSCNLLPWKIKNEIVNEYLLSDSQTRLYNKSNDVDLKLFYTKYIESRYCTTETGNIIASEIDASNRIGIATELSKITTHNFSIDDIVRTKGNNVCTALNIPHTHKHTAFVEQWVNLHPLHIRELLC